MEPLQVKESDPLNGRPWSVQLEVGSLEQDIQKKETHRKPTQDPVLYELPGVLLFWLFGWVKTQVWGH